jgi:hypothetical protein
MITSKDVFAKRKEGEIDEAYQMALQLMSGSQPDEWDIKAFGWCLISLIKRDVASNQTQNISHYKQQLESIDGPALDDVLAKSKRYALSLCNPNSEILNHAKKLSQDENFDQSISIYKKLVDEGEADPAVHTSLAWDLYKQSKILLGLTPLNIGKIKYNINLYLKLNTEKPSMLHSCILQIASKCGAEDNFNMLAFSHMWDLKNIRREDLERFRGDDGKEYPALVERVIKQATRDGINASDNRGIEYILPYLDKTIGRFKDNIWLKLNKAKALLMIGNVDDALSFALAVTKEKSSDFWSWDLLGDVFINTEPDIAFNCFCKSLLCTNDINFTSKVKLKLAKLLVRKEQLAAAKFELSAIKAFRENAGHKVPEEVGTLCSQSWFQTTQASESNIALYKEHSKQAEELLFSQLPWLNANVGEKYFKNGKESKPKRKIFVSTASGEVETSISNAQFKFDSMVEGSAIKVKGEHAADKPFQIFTVEPRKSDQLWDAIPEKIGIIDHVNKEKKLIHFIVNVSCDGVIPFANPNPPYEEGDSIAVRVCEYKSKQGKRFRVLANRQTNKEPSSSVKKRFSEQVRVENGMGFTSNDIFIPPPMVSKNEIKDSDNLTGIAVLNYNTKRACWGWKALSIAKN